MKSMSASANYSTGVANKKHKKKVKMEQDNRFFTRSSGRLNNSKSGVSSAFSRSFDSSNRNSNFSEAKPNTSRHNPLYLQALVKDLMTSKNKQVVVILRGIPGSGKSFLGKQIQQQLLEEYNVFASICSADLFFETRHGYAFDPKLLASAHQNCRKQFLRELQASKASSGSGTSPRPSVVLVDNTNTQKWEYEAYEADALANGFELHILEVKCPDLLTATRVAKRNSHGVPLDRVLAMFARWEDDNRPFVKSFAPLFDTIVEQNPDRKRKWHKQTEDEDKVKHAKTRKT